MTTSMVIQNRELLSTWINKGLLSVTGMPAPDYDATDQKYPY